MKTVYVAEDDQFLANAYLVKLKSAGYDVVVVSNGKELLDAVKAKKPDIILVDLIMPIMDGFEALQKIKTNKETASIPVIIASNLNQNDDIEKGMKLGAVDYIVKSDTSLDDLIKKMESHIK